MKLRASQVSIQISHPLCSLIMSKYGAVVRTSLAVYLTVSVVVSSTHSSFCDSSSHFIFLQLKISNSSYAVLLIFQICVVPKMSAVVEAAVVAVF